jgi:hypothetical protein
VICLVQCAIILQGTVPCARRMAPFRTRAEMSFRTHAMRAVSCEHHTMYHSMGAAAKRRSENPRRDAVQSSVRLRAASGMSLDSETRGRMRKNATAHR